MNARKQPTLTISRRDAISRIAALLGGTVVGMEFLLNGARLEGKPPGAPFSAAELALMDEIGDTIIPATDTPGAKAAKIGEFMALIVTECYEPEDEATFRSGLLEIDAASVDHFGKGFMDSTPAERTALLNQLDKAERASRASSRPTGYFGLMKQLTVLGYFTSEIGCTQALRFVESPGFFIGCAPYEQGQPQWFTNVGRGFAVGS